MDTPGDLFTVCLTAHFCRPSADSAVLALLRLRLQCPGQSAAKCLLRGCSAQGLIALQELVERWKQTQVTHHDLQLPMEQYVQHLQETLITPMKSHQIGCVMAFLSASELAANSFTDDRGGCVRLRVSANSRLSLNLQV
jgi:hypothetical protein